MSCAAAEAKHPTSAKSHDQSRVQTKKKAYSTPVFVEFLRQPVVFAWVREKKRNKSEQ